MLAKGEKVFIITRRLFESDVRRHFAGEVLESSSALIKTKGFVFVFDDINNDFVKRDDERTRIFSLLDAGILLIVLPTDVNLAEIKYSSDEKYRRVLTDGKDFKMNISEFGANR